MKGEKNKFFPKASYLSLLGRGNYPLSIIEDAIHTKDLALQNATSDQEINSLSMLENRIVITKDHDFFDSFLIRQEPYKLLLVTTGNISNNELMNLFINNLSHLVQLLEENSLVEMSINSITVHQ